MHRSEPQAAEAARRDPNESEHPDVLRGIGLKVLSVLVFTLMAICIKASAPHVPPGERVFFRSFFAMPVILLWLVMQGNLRAGLVTRRPWGHAWRGCVGTSAMALNFTALGLLPLPEATAISYTAPLLTVILAVLLLREEIRAFRLTAVLVGIVGVLIVLAPQMTVLEGGAGSRLQAIGAAAALGAAVFVAWAQIILRRLVTLEATPAIVFYFSLSASVLALLSLPFGWVVPTGREALLLVLSGLLGGIGQILLTEGYRYATAGILAPFSYVSMIFALVFGYLLFDEIPTQATMAGATLIVAAGLFIIWRERQIGIERGARRAMTPQG